jgi:putative Ca2+/H+ antiporter (TMEM165/GDT1 family)
MTAFWISLLFVAIAEMGDKTQLVALAFATRYRATKVLAGVFVATLAVHLVSVFLGEMAGMALPCSGSTSWPVCRSSPLTPGR